jgi:hypothetical protein
MNWGKGIALALLVFMSLMVFMVFKAVNQRFDLVAKDYYADEIAYQQVMDKEQNLRNLDEKIEVKQTLDGILVTFPGDFEGKQIVGTAVLYRPSDERMDKTFDFRIESLSYLIPAEAYNSGKWELKLDWTVDGVAYYYKEQIIL